MIARLKPLIPHIAAAFFSKFCQHFSKDVCHLLATGCLTFKRHPVKPNIGNVECGGISVSRILRGIPICFPQSVDVIIRTQDRRDDNPMFSQTLLTHSRLKARAYLIQKSLGSRGEIRNRVFQRVNLVQITGFYLDLSAHIQFITIGWWFDSFLACSLQVGIVVITKQISMIDINIFPPIDVMVICIPCYPKEYGGQYENYESGDPCLLFLFHTIYMNI